MTSNQSADSFLPSLKARRGDALIIAATAVEHDLTLITRNRSDFEITEVPLINPWEA